MVYDRRVLRAALVALLCGAMVWGAACQTPDPAGKEAIDPETATGFEQRKAVRSTKTMVAAANPLATAAGLEILREGGSAVDATIAMALVLSLVEPQSSGIGGGAFMLHRNQADGKMVAYDGRETAPAAATGDMFESYAGGGMESFMKAVIGGLSVGAPGLLRMFEQAHKAHGKLPWARLFEPAIKLCQEGFEISPRLHSLVSRDPFLAKMPATREYFFDAQGNPKAVGTRIINEPMGKVLQAVATDGADAFYTGPIAEAIVKAVQENTTNPGRLTMEDMAAYKSVAREPVCAPYRQNTVCGMSPPTSGGVTPLQILGILENFELGKLDPDSAEAAHLFAEAARLAYADRDMYLGDPDFVQMPVEQLLSREYLKERAALINMDKTMGKAAAGEIPEPGTWNQWSPDTSPDVPSTSHMVAIDAEGNAVTMTASIEGAFGSHIMVNGFLLNNELTDFSFVPQVDGRPVANRVEPGKRPRSSMAPLFVLDDKGNLKMAVGSPGGSRIILYVTRVVLGVLDWDMDIQQAIARPNVINRNGATELEQGVPGFEAWLTDVTKGLEARGHEVRPRDLNSGIQGIVVTPEGYIGGADPRREGLVLGD